MQRFWSFIAPVQLWPADRHQLNTGITEIADDYGPSIISPEVSEEIFKSEYSFVQKKNGIVFVQVYGLVKTNSTFTFATLPTGLRPYATVRSGPIIFNDDGNVTSSGSVQDNGFIRISGLAGKYIIFSISYPAHH